MALETVEISVNDDQVVPEPVDGVVVRVFDDTGTTLITQATTGVPLAGRVQFTLDGDGPTPMRYQLRFFINGGAIHSPQYIDVFSPPALAPTAANNFEVEAAIFVLPTATNPRLCRASGFIWGPDGRPRRGVDIAFIPCFKGPVIDGFGVLGERVNCRSDKNGYVSVDLIRSGIYSVTIESQENTQRPVHVPDRSSINIFHLLYPRVVGVEYDPPGPWTLSVNGALEVVPVVLSSDYRTLGVADEDVEYTTLDSSIASVSVQADKITLRGHAVGSTTLRVRRRDNTVVYIPDPGINDGEIPITVA